MRDSEAHTTRRSIRTKLLWLLLGLTAAAIVVVSIIGVNATQSSGRQAQTISSQALLDQATDNLLRSTQDTAANHALVFEQVLKQGSSLAALMADVFDHPNGFDRESFWNADEHMAERAEGQYANGAEDISSVFVPNSRTLDADTVRDIELSAFMDLNIQAIFQASPNVEAIYFATQRDVVRYYPNIDLGSVLPPDFRATQRVWYTGSLPENDPERKAWWTPVYGDATGRGLVTTAAIPVYDEDRALLGVIGLDVTLDNLQTAIESNRFLQRGYSFLIDKDGLAIALPEQGYGDLLGGGAPQEGTIPDLKNAGAAFASVIENMRAGESGLENIQSAQKRLFVAYAPLESTGWSMATVVEERDILESVSGLAVQFQQGTRALVLRRILPISVAIFAVVIGLGLWVTNRLVTPIQNLVAATEEFGAGNLNVEVAVETDDEIGILADAFRTMVSEVKGFITTLEQRVSERTKELERRSLQIQVAAEVARDVSATRDLSELLQRAVNLVRDRFGFYHAGIFLVDEKREYVALRAATGEAGRKMLLRGHKLRIGETGIVGYATGSGQPRIALDVGIDAVHFQNPLLPDTRSEIALPLKSGDQVIGALDVQSKQAAAFSEEDVTVLQIMADQLAVAIENARLLQRVQESMQDLEAFYGHYNRQSWEMIVNAQPFLGYEFERGKVNPLDEEARADSSATDSPEEQAGKANTFQIPLRVRGEAIGALDVWPAQEAFSSEDRELLLAVGERISQALESARIFEETQVRAARERALNEMSAKMTRSMDIETLLRNAVVELGQLPQVVEAALHISPAVEEEQAVERPSNGKGRAPNVTL
jgi:GAF domain-containing protein/HAMP domain-containing protein